MNALFYLTYNGIHTYTDGIATQTKILLSSLESNYKEFSNIWGNFNFFLICPKEIDEDEKSKNPHWTYAKKITSDLGGEIIEISIGKNNIWTLGAWEKLSKNTAKKLADLIDKNNYDDILVIVVDPPFLHVPLLFNTYSKKSLNVKFLIALYSTAYIHERKKINLKRLSWEFLGISSSRLYDNIFLGDVCSFMKDHLIEYYGADNKKFVPFVSSLNLSHPDFNMLTESEILTILKENNIPIDKQLLFSFGRADWIKGFDILLNEMPFVNKNSHLVLIVVPYNKELVIVNMLRKIIYNLSIDCTLIVGFNRDLPKALCQHKNTKIVIIPSRGEPFSNIPFEVALWARNMGPICLTTNIDGFQEQIIEKFNGFKFDLNKKFDLSEKANYILKLSNKSHLKIRKNAEKLVLTQRDFKANFITTLKYINNI